MDIILLYNI